MDAEQRRHSLADEAANWVPPWARGDPEPEATPEAAAGPHPDGYPEAHGEAEGGRTPEQPEPAEQPDPPEPAEQPESAEQPEPAEQPESAEQPDPPEPADGSPLMDPSRLRGALEAILLVLDEPTSDVVLAQVLEQPTKLVAAALAELAAEYAHSGRGFELRRAAGGWRLYTRPEFAPYVERFVLDGQQTRLTQAALETLAVVAYKQPVTRSRISAIRGVNCDGVIRTLVARGLIEECGSEPETGAFLYRTTSLFLERLGLDSLDELPSLAPFLPDDVDEITDAQQG